MDPVILFHPVGGVPPEIKIGNDVFVYLKQIETENKIQSGDACFILACKQRKQKDILGTYCLLLLGALKYGNLQCYRLLPESVRHYSSRQYEWAIAHSISASSSSHSASSSLLQDQFKNICPQYLIHFNRDTRRKGFLILTQLAFQYRYPSAIEYLSNHTLTKQNDFRWEEIKDSLRQKHSLTDLCMSLVQQLIPWDVSAAMQCCQLAAHCLNSVSAHIQLVRMSSNQTLCIPSLMQAWNLLHDPRLLQMVASIDPNFQSCVNTCLQQSNHDWCLFLRECGHFELAANFYNSLFLTKTIKTEKIKKPN